MRQLGNTLAEIAFEKAGIVKPGVPVVSGVTADEPREVIERVCASAAAPLVQIERDFTYRYYPPHLVDRHASCGRIDFSMAGPPAATYQNVQLGMLGRHQAVNAAVALATITQLQSRGWKIAESHIRSGLAQARSAGARGSRQPQADDHPRRGAQRSFGGGASGDTRRKLRRAAEDPDLRDDPGQIGAGNDGPAGAALRADFVDPLRQQSAGCRSRSSCTSRPN